LPGPIREDEFVEKLTPAAWHKLCSLSYWSEEFFTQRSIGKDEAMAGNNWLKVVDVMTKNPLSMTPGETIGQADEVMAENRIRQLPVVSGSALLGIITDRDIRSFLDSASIFDPDARAKALATEIKEVMTTNPLTLSPDDDLQEAVELLIEEKIGGIPVMDEAEGLIGIVTYVDVLRCFLDRLREEQS
jgi:acetoin utilization protein AcuB